MARKRRRPQRRSKAVWWWVGGVAAAVLVVWLGGMALRPAGLRDVGTPITTLIGEEAPVLEFPDAAGRTYRVPERGRATVLIFHMGLH